MTRSYTLSEPARARREAQKQFTRQALLDAARAIAAERGVEAISVVEVSRRAGVSHSLINAYFDGKVGLIAALVKGVYGALLERTEAIAAGPGSEVDRLRAILVDWAAFDLADPKLLRVLQAHGWTWSEAAEAANRADRQAFLAPVGALIRAGQGAGVFRQKVALEDALPAIWAIYTVGMRDAVFATPVPSPEDAVAAIWGQIAAVLDAVSTR
jgi:AcrR family transcriptional regulator